MAIIDKHKGIAAMISKDGLMNFAFHEIFNSLGRFPESFDSEPAQNRLRSSTQSSAREFLTTPIEIPETRGSQFSKSSLSEFKNRTI